MTPSAYVSFSKLVWLLPREFPIAFGRKDDGFCPRAHLAVPHGLRLLLAGIVRTHLVGSLEIFICASELLHMIFAAFPAFHERLWLHVYGGLPEL